MSQYEIFEPGNENELQQLWTFNHQIFAEELGQHRLHDDGRLIDKFHHKNFYRAVRLRSNGKVVGMICAHCTPPYSVEEKLGRPVEPPADGGRLGEIRLYAVHPAHRKSMASALSGISMLLALREKNVTEVVISGVERQKRFYERLGFRAIGEPVLSGQAVFYPMRARLDDILTRLEQEVHRIEALLSRQKLREAAKATVATGSPPPGLQSSNLS